MIKLFNNILNKEKKIVYELTKIYGVNKFQSLEICKNLNINPKLKLKQLNINIFHKISNYMEKNFEIEKNLKWTIKTQIEEKKKLRSYKGLRHSLKLPLNGQRTHSNAKTFKRVKSL